MKINLEKIREQKSLKELIEFSIINIDKPANPTSFGVDTIVKKALGLRKSSHFGTLDPMVTGVLPVALNRACKLMGYFIGKKKTYVGIMRLHEEISKEKLQKEIRNFVGKIIQLPPVKSRVKREERQREVYSFKILEIDGKNVLFETEVEAGTYIRKLIHDLGLEIGGAHMLELRRTRVSIFGEEESHTIYEFLDAVEKNELKKILIPGEVISKILPVVEVKKEVIQKLYHGSPLFKKFVVGEKKFKEGEKICVFCREKFIGVYSVISHENVLGRAEFVLQPLK